MDPQTMIKRHALRAVRREETLFAFLLTRCIWLFAAWALGRALGWWATAAWRPLVSFAPIGALLGCWLITDYWRYTKALRRLVPEACSQAWLWRMTARCCDDALKNDLLAILGQITGQTTGDSPTYIREIGCNLLVIEEEANARPLFYFIRCIPSATLPISLLPLYNADDSAQMILTTGEINGIVLPSRIKQRIITGTQLSAAAKSAGLFEADNIQHAAVWLQTERNKPTMRRSPAGLAAIGAMLLGCAMFTPRPTLCLMGGLGLFGWAGILQWQQKKAA